MHASRRTFADLASGNGDPLPSVRSGHLRGTRRHYCRCAHQLVGLQGADKVCRLLLVTILFSASLSKQPGRAHARKERPQNQDHHRSFARNPRHQGLIDGTHHMFRAADWFSRRCSLGRFRSSSAYLPRVMRRCTTSNVSPISRLPLPCRISGATAALSVCVRSHDNVLMHSSFWTATPFIITVVTFATYAALGNTLSLSVIFTAIGTFNVIRMPISSIPWLINGIVSKTYDAFGL